MSRSISRRKPINSKCFERDAREIFNAGHDVKLPPPVLYQSFLQARDVTPLPPVYRRCPPFLLSQRVPMHWRRDFADAIRSTTTTTTTTNGTSCMKKVQGTKPRGSVISSRKAKKKRDVDALPRSPSQRNSCWYRAKKLTFTHYTLSLSVFLSSRWNLHGMVESNKIVRIKNHRLA